VNIPPAPSSRKDKRRQEAQAALQNSALTKGPFITGKTGEWEIVVGLEIHAQIQAQTKLFSNAPTSYGKTPNSQVALVDAALPGSLPVINRFCIEQAMKTGLAIRGKINTWSAFDRKHYFYCDMPTGYQITQYYTPIVSGGRVVLNKSDNTSKEVRIERIQLETDSGKSLHDQHPTMTYVDLNRAGSGLMEIVTFPDISSPLEASQFVKKVQFLLQHIGTCDGNMEEGSLRVDANVSVRRKGTTEKGTRCEIKNLNSIQSLIRAIDYEAHRQVELLESGSRVGQETRWFDPTKRETFTGRKKEDDVDYRYFPEPDLPPLTVEDALVEEIASKLPELPDEIERKLLKEYNLSAYEADVLANHYGAYVYFKEAVAGRDPAQVANWITNDLFGHLNDRGLELSQSPMTAAQLGQLLDLLSTGKISGRIAKELVEYKFTEGDKRDPAEIVQEKGWYQMTDTTALKKMCEEIVAKSPEIVAEIKAGRTRKVQSLVGQVMKQTGGKAPGPLVTGIFSELIGVKLD
jgi:aspartyl-tRNA(Asn)/glutamyl-tRNA(Gln) amidotransferase subunit B